MTNETPNCIEAHRRKEKLTFVALARKVGAPVPTVQRHCKGLRVRIREPYLSRYRAILGSDFRAEDFLGFIPPASAPIGFESGPPVAAHPPDPPP